jgi:hypothetical protein
MNFLSQLFRFITTPIRWLLALPMWVISSPRRVMGMSLPARAALLVFLILMICAIAAVWIVASTSEAPSITVYLLTWQFAVVVILIFLIPFVVYYWLKLWLEGDASRFPDIDAAWQEGMKALQQNGADLSAMPIFLVIGAPEDRLTKSLFKSTGFEWVIRDTPSGLAPLRWFVDERAIYVVCIETGRLGKLHRIGRREGSGGHAVPDARATIQPSGNIRGTMAAGGGSARDTAIVNEGTRDSPSEVDMNVLRGTLVPGGGGGSRPSGPSTAAPSSGSSILSRHEAELESDRLHYVCELLRRARQPVCAMNGILVLLPFDTVHHVMVAKDIPAAMKSDLETIRQATKLRCPVTTLVTGMEQESGFGELVRRVGTSKAKANRFGKGFDVWNSPTAENIDAFSSHACGAFEDWVYNLFRERDGLNKPGNAKLYMLLCRIRSEVRARLRNILLHGLSFDPNDKDEQDRPLLFNGCYFAATGDTDDRQAFVRNVFEKMLDMEEELEWTPEAWQEENRYQRLAQLGLAIDGALVLGLIGMFVARYWWKV